MPGAYSNDSDTRQGIALTAIERAGGNGAEIVYVGDGLWDYRTASSLGFGFVGITHESDEDRLRSAGASVFLKNYSPPSEFFAAVRRASEFASGHRAGRSVP